MGPFISRGWESTLTVAWASRLRPVLDQGLEGPSSSMRNLQNLGGSGEGPGPRLESG